MWNLVGCNTTALRTSCHVIKCNQSRSVRVGLQKSVDFKIQGFFLKESLNISNLEIYCGQEQTSRGNELSGWIVVNDPPVVNYGGFLGQDAKLLVLVMEIILWNEIFKLRILPASGMKWQREYKHVKDLRQLTMIICGHLF